MGLLSKRILWRNNQATYFYWIKAGIFLRRGSFICEDAAVCFAIYYMYYWLHSSSLCHATWFSLTVRRRVFSKELTIAKPAKNISTIKVLIADTCTHTLFFYFSYSIYRKGMPATSKGHVLISKLQKYTDKN